MQCKRCKRVLRPRSFTKGSLCPTCWRWLNRGPRLKGLFALFERLIAKPGTLTRALAFLGVSRSTVHRWREGTADPHAENVLALDEFVRTEVVIRIGERFDGQPPKMRVPAESVAKSPSTSPLEEPEPSERHFPDEVHQTDAYILRSGCFGQEINPTPLRPDLELKKLVHVLTFQFPRAR